jgi:hypothetical protein
MVRPPALCQVKEERATGNIEIFRRLLAAEQGLTPSGEEALSLLSDPGEIAYTRVCPKQRKALYLDSSL